jgi:hypothetical protein
LDQVTTLIGMGQDQSMINKITATIIIKIKWSMRISREKIKNGHVEKISSNWKQQSWICQFNVKPNKQNTQIEAFLKITAPMDGYATRECLPALFTLHSLNKKWNKNKSAVMSAAQKMHWAAGWLGTWAMISLSLSIQLLCRVCEKRIQLFAHASVKKWCNFGVAHI